MHHVCLECGQTYAGGGACLHDGAALAPWGEDPVLGQTIGSWRVTRLLGAGGMGRVYRAIQPSIGAKVAIKVLSQEASEDKELVDRFFDEAKMVGHIGHEHIVKVFDFGTLPDRRSYFVMEYLEGASLASIIRRRGSLPLGSLARVVGEVLAALGAAHAKGVIHRDLKPDNIWVTPAGHAKVLDFGIAKLVARDATRGPTQTGSLLGTPAYMPPEQAAGRVVDLRADLYATGVVLYEAVTGTPPFMATALYELLRKIIQEPPPALRSLRPDLPPGFEQTILRAMAKEPHERFASAAEMGAALSAAIQGLPGTAWESLGAAEAGTFMPTPTRGGSNDPGAHASWGSPPLAADSGPTREGSPFQPTALAGAHAHLPPTRVPAHGTTTHSGTAGQLAARTRPPARAGLKFGLGALALMLAGAAIAVVATRGLRTSDEHAASADGPVVATRAAAAPIPLVPPIVRPPTPGPGPAPTPTPTAPPDAAPAKVAVTPAPRVPKVPKVKPPVGPTAPTETPANPLANLPPTLGGTAVGPANPPANPTTPWDGEGPPPRLQPIMNPAGETVNLKRIDVQKMLARSQKLARQLMDDAQLVRMDVSYVAPDGSANLLLGSSGYAMFHYRSPKRSKRGDTPVGVGLQCKVMVMVNPSQGVYIVPTDDHQCTDATIGMPRCSVVDIWKRALDVGAPADGVAQIALWHHEGRRKWLFMVASFSQMFEDDC